MGRILLLEDDFILANEICSFLTRRNFVCQVIINGTDIIKMDDLNNFDLFLLDINVPHLNGIEVCRYIRRKDKQTPIMMVTALGELDEKLICFKAGADDYLVKPFHLEELLVRIISLTRRNSNAENQTKVCISDLEINFENKTVWRSGLKIQLTNKEFTLLSILVEAKGKVLSKKEIAYRLWDDQFETSFNTIEVYINFLRKKIDKQFDEKLIHTKMGFGYYIGKSTNDN